MVVWAERHRRGGGHPQMPAPAVRHCSLSLARDAPLPLQDAARQHSPPGGWRALEERVAALGKEAESVTDAAGAAAVMRGASELLMEVEERLVVRDT